MTRRSASSAADERSTRMRPAVRRARASGRAVARRSGRSIKIVAIVVPLILCVAYLTLWERKVIGWMQVRIGPNRVGPLGLLQPFADVLKLLFKEIIVPTGANKALFFLAPMLTIMPALAAWAVIPFSARAGARRTSTPACCTSWRSPRSGSTA